MEDVQVTCHDGYVEQKLRQRVAQGAAALRIAAEEATEMGVISLVAGLFLFLIPGACVYVGYMTDSGKM